MRVRENQLNVEIIEPQMAAIRSGAEKRLAARVGITRKVRVLFSKRASERVCLCVHCNWHNVVRGYRVHIMRGPLV